MDMNLNKVQEMVEDREAWHAAAWLQSMGLQTAGHNLATRQQQ